MFQLKLFHIPKVLSPAYCKKVARALEEVMKEGIPHPDFLQGRPHPGPLPKGEGEAQQGIVNIIAVPPTEIAWMNEQYRGKEGPTDILTFSFFKKNQNKPPFVKGGADDRRRGDFGNGNKKILKKILSHATQNTRRMTAPFKKELGYTNQTQNLVVGEIYLCLEKIQIYAKESGKTYKEQLEYIIIHGLVHLMGFDHETEEDAKEMEEVERKISQIIDNG